MHVVIFNSRYWDRTLEAFYRELNSKKSKSLGFEAFKLPNDYSHLRNALTASLTKSLTLVGSFRNLEDPTSRPDEELLDLFRHSICPRLWILFFDLHHTPEDLILGKKTKLGNDFEVPGPDHFSEYNFFDMLAWPYEFFDPQILDLVNYKIPSEEIEHSLFAIAQAVETHKRLIDEFPHRMEFYHCIGRNELKQSFSLVPNFMKFDICIPGAPYITRRIAREFFSQRGFSVMRSDFGLAFLNLFLRLSNWICQLLMLPPESRWKLKSLIKFRYQTFQTGFCRFTWVDGSYLNYPVRKFIEVPLSGSIVLTGDSSVLRALGFLNDFNYRVLKLNNPNQISLRSMKMESSQIESSFKDLRRTIWEQHGAETRVAQLKTFLEKFCAPSDT